jgi:hypothetical protein
MSILVPVFARHRIRLPEHRFGVGVGILHASAGIPADNRSHRVLVYRNRCQNRETIPNISENARIYIRRGYGPSPSAL